MKRHSLLLLLPLLLTLGGCKDEMPKEKENTSLLFVLHGKQGSYSNGVLTVSHVNQSVTYFSDGPERKAGTLPLNDFLKLWDEKNKESFEHAPPNAGFVFFEGKNQGYSDVPIELKKPQYNVASQTVTFTVRALENTSLPEHAMLDEVSLFIDSFGSDYADILYHSQPGVY